MNIQRKPRMFFDEAPSPASVTFDDGERSCRNMPWMRYMGAEWDHSDPASFRIEIGEWQIVISGHNLEPMFAALEHARLARIRAYPEFADDPAHEIDVFAISIRFIHLGPASGRGGRGGQPRLPL